MGQFVLDLKKFAEKANANMEFVVRKVLFDVSARFVEMSPVDTGRFRANWQYGTNSIPEGEVGDEKQLSWPDAQGSKDSLSTALGKAKMVGNVHFIVNNLPYATTIEYGGYQNPPKQGSKKRGEDGVAVHVTGGYSMQAPRGIVRVTVLEVGQYYQQAIEALK